MHIAFCVAELRNTPHMGDKTLNAYIVIKYFFVPFWSVAKLFHVKHCLLFYTVAVCLFDTVACVIFALRPPPALRAGAPRPSGGGIEPVNCFFFSRCLIQAHKCMFRPYRFR